MSEWSYSEEELDQYFSDPAVRGDKASPNGQPNGVGPDGRSSGLRGFFYRTFRNPLQAQAAYVLSLVTGGLLVGVLGLSLYVWTLTDDVPSTQRLENPTFSLATVAYTADGQELARYARQNRSWVPYDSISSHAVHALVATEDHRFYQHWGVDLQGIFAAVLDLFTGELRGASTITQQLARNLYNERVGRAVTIERKLKEMVTAVELERRYTKREIIEMYLNTVSFGSNAYGIEAAARTYFGISAPQLDPLQAATLIGSLKATTYYNPVRNPDHAKARRNVVLSQMTKRGFLEPSFYEEHADDGVNAEYHSAELYASMAPYFAEYVRNWMEDWAAANDRDVYADGLRVYTTLDGELQKLASDAVNEQMEGLQKVVGYQWSQSSGALLAQQLSRYQELEPGEDYTPFEHFWNSRTDVVDDWIRETDRYRALRRQDVRSSEAVVQLRENEAFMDSLKTIQTRLEAGLVSIDPRNGHVKVWIGGRDFRSDKYDKVGIAKRQPGSTFKPFTYTAAIDNGYSPYDTFIDSTVTWKDEGADKIWSPKNFGGSDGQSYTLSQGLARSMNTITAQLVLEINPSTVATYARRMGIQSELQEVPSIALGTSNVTLLEMTSAYSTLANGGLYNEPVVVTRIEDRYGNVLWEATPRPREALSERTAYTVVDMMRGVIDYGTGIRIRTQFQLGSYDLAGKTGTTQNAADTWFMLMHPDLVTGSWVGFNDQRLTFRTSWWGQGAHSALFLVGDYYRSVASSDKVTLPKTSFPMAEDYGPPETNADSTQQDNGGRVAGNVQFRSANFELRIRFDSSASTSSSTLDIRNSTLELVKLLHTADIHLGFKTYGRHDSETGLNTRLLDVRRSFEAMVERAVAEDVDAFLFCGDAYHTADPTPTQQKIFAECLRPIADADIPIILVIGNHDHPVTFGRASSLDIFEYVTGDIFFYRTTQKQVQVVDTKSGPLQLIPLPWPIRSQILTKEAYRNRPPDQLRETIEEMYVRYVQRRAEDVRTGAMGVRRDGTEVPLSPDAPTVLAGHVTVKGSALSGSERTSLIASEPTFSVGQLAVSPIDYVALGHIHQYQDRNDGHAPPVVYAGSIERVTFKERDERKGFCLVTIDPDAATGADARTTVDFVETPARPFASVTVDARESPDPTELILTAIDGVDVTDAIVRVRYQIEEAQVTQVDAARIRDALAPADTVAAIERSVDPTERKRRTVVTRDSDLEDAVRQYVGQHDDLQSIEDDLVEAAKELEAEYESTRRSE